MRDETRAQRQLFLLKTSVLEPISWPMAEIDRCIVSVLPSLLTDH